MPDEDFFFAAVLRDEQRPDVVRDLFAFLLNENGTPLRNETGQGLIKLEESP